MGDKKMIEQGQPGQLALLSRASASQKLELIEEITRARRAVTYS